MVKNLKKKRLWLIKTTALIFIATILIKFWSWIADFSNTIILVTGILLIIYLIIFPEFSIKKFLKGVIKAVRG